MIKSDQGVEGNRRVKIWRVKWNRGLISESDKESERSFSYIHSGEDVGGKPSTRVITPLPVVCISSSEGVD